MARSRRMSAQKRLRERRKAQQAELKRVTTRSNGSGTPTDGPIVRIYLSFDLEHDQDLHERLTQQAHDLAPFAIASRSEGGEMTEAWSERVRSRIAESDEVVVICGEHTDDSLHVSAELAIAQQQNKPYVLLWGRRGSMCKKPHGARSEEGMYMWTPGSLEHRLAYHQRGLAPAA